MIRCIFIHSRRKLNRMAIRINGITVESGVDTTKLSKELDANKYIKALGTTLEEA